MAKLAGATGFRRFFDFASPAFFDVVPARKLWGEAKALVASRRDDEAFGRLVDDRTARFRALDLEIDPEASDRQPLEALDEARRAAVGETILRLYFGQVFASEEILLDLGKARFTHTDGRLVWRPGRGHAQWAPDFHAAIRGMYRGFYREDEALLRSALDDVDLGSAAPIFRRHFGDGVQTAVTFTTDHFVDSFHEVFLHCKREEIRLHENFLSLGVYLATLYETLEALAVPLDVRGAFFDADPATEHAA